MLEAALFDLDGTLLDTAPDLALAANALRLEYGMPLLREELVATFVGKGMENLVRRVLAGSLHPDDPPPRPIDQALAAFKQHYHRVNGDRARIYDGVVEGLQTMRADGLKLAVVTNKPTEFTVPLLAQTGLAGFFGAVVCGDTCEHKKPHPQPILHACEQLHVAPGRAVMIGDSVNDTLAARAAGAITLVVPYGYNEGRDVGSLDSDGVVASIPQAATWLRTRNAA